MLQEISSAWVSVDLVARAAGPAVVVGQVGGGQRQVEAGRAGHARESSVYLPVDSAAAAVTSLKVEPGG